MGEIADYYIEQIMFEEAQEAEERDAQIDSMARGKYWITNDEKEINIEDMDMPHLVNVIKMIRSHDFMKPILNVMMQELNSRSNR